MAVSINTAGTFKVVRPSNADTLTGWAAETLEGSGGSASLLASVGTIDLVAEGTDARASRVNKQRVLIYFTNAAGYDFTSGSTGTGTTKVPSGMAYVWAAFLAAGSALLKANGGLQICLGDGTNRSFWNVAGSDTYSGGFEKWAVYSGITRSENDGADADLGDITQIGFVCDVGGTTTRFDNMVVDAIDLGDGLTFQGTTTTDKLFAEATAQDAATAIGVLNEENGTIFAQGNVEFSGTAMTSISEKFTFIDKLGGAYTYNFDITGTVTMTNSSVDADGAVDYNFDTGGATAFAMTGGSVGKFATLTTAAGQTISGTVFQSGGTSSIANTITSAPFNQCGTITVTGTLDACTINKSTASTAVTGTNTNKVPGCTFIKDTAASHAFELTGAAATYTWSGFLTGYDAGTSGNGVQVTGVSITGNEAIHIPATTGTYIINVADGADIPSVSTGGAIVNVVAGQKTFTFNVKLAGVGITAYEWRVYTVTAVGSLAGAVELDGEESATLATQSITHSFTNQPIAVQVIEANTYVEKVEYFTLTASDLTVDINLEIETNV